MGRPHKFAAVALAAALCSSGCYGPFYTVRKVWEFNGQVSDNKWIVEVVYLVCAGLYVYGIAVAADALIFNAIEFWGGKNPMADSANAGGASPERRIVRGDTEFVLKQEADALVVAQLRGGRPGPMLRLQRAGQGTVALNGDGTMLLSAYTLPDGRVVIQDAAGAQVASYSGDQAERLLASLRQ
jgi:hypothetical protein